MHNALLIHEVLGRVVDYLAEDTARHPTAFPPKDTRKSGRRALGILARTCRAFSEPALDSLWRRLHSLKPFMLCLAKASYNDTSVEGAISSFDDKEWDILLRYTPRVQELTLEHDQPSMKILQSLWFRTVLLLPNLRKLRWMYEDYTAIASIRLLLSPSLAHLHVWLDGGDHSSVLGLLESYHTLCPDLKSLYFGHLCRFPHVTAAISRAICRPPNLEILNCDPIDEAALIYIADSRCLTKFSANLHTHQPDSLRKIAGYSTPDHPPFENLRILELRVEDISSIIPYLKSQHQPLEDVSFDFRMLPTPEVFYELFTALSSATRRRTLRRVRLQSVGLIADGISPEPVNFQVLSPLMTFHLHTVKININNPVSLNDDELHRLVQAWPELEAFSFNQYYEWNNNDRASFHIPTLRGLLLLLARCPKLHDLGLCVDARNVPSLTENKTTICNTAITKLSVVNSLIQEPVASVAHFLLEHLPSLTMLTAWTSFGARSRSSQDYRRMWKEVELQVRKIHGRDSSPETSDSEME
ncbi:hypothetical protein EV363DRAFT_1307710, partial [Boletus edulis]